MARGTFISDFERDVIRIGLHVGASYGQIARYLGRTKPAISNQAKSMDANGSLGDLPFCFVVDKIGGQILEQ